MLFLQYIYSRETFLKHYFEVKGYRHIAEIKQKKSFKKSIFDPMLKGSHNTHNL